ncbi:helix-turn-helix transcriptional regulator [Acetobacterium sp.]|uniref:helix-turn-helix domain-containing protein n=1 Tax=Acetobacterium sp. TaxID=1872094 RepID=UPI002F41E580
MEYKQQQIIMNNIDKLLEKRGIKRSAIEDAVSISHGYLSRLKKPEGSTYNLSYDLLNKIADYLKVSMDYLTLNTLDRTTDENSLIDFLKSLYSMSVEDSLYWHIFTLKQIDSIYDPWDWSKLGPIATTIDYATPDEFEFFPDHIVKKAEKQLSQEIEYSGPSCPWRIPWIGWLSLRLGRKIGDAVFTKATITDDFFYAPLKKINSTLYLYRVEYTDADGKNKLSDIVEAYLVTGDKELFLCNSIEWGKFISSKLKDLYQIAKDKSSCNRLDEDARKLLNQFNTN